MRSVFFVLFAMIPATIAAHDMFGLPGDHSHGDTFGGAVFSQQESGISRAVCVTLPDGTKRCFDSPAAADAFIASLNRSPGHTLDPEPSAATSSEMFGLSDCPDCPTVVRSVTRTRTVAEPRRIAPVRRVIQRQPVRRVLRRQPVRTFVRRLFGLRGRTVYRSSYVVQSSHMRSRPAARASGRWTVAGGIGNIDNHLRGWPHFVDPSGMSLSQKLAIHDQHHDRIGPVSGRQLRAMNSGRQ